MGLRNWLFGSRNDTAEGITVSDADAKKCTDTPVTMEASMAEESHLTMKKRFLYLYLAFLAVMWNDVAKYIFGWLGQTVTLILTVYVLVLLYPAKIGRFDVKDRMQIRAVLIIELSALSALFVFPFWFMFVGDSHWFPGAAATSFGPFRTLFVVYVAWYAFLDRNASRNGGRMSTVMRKRRFWKHFANYFPVKFTRTTKLDPAKNYLFGYHPHGIISVGAMVNFGTYATRGDELFEGLDIRLGTLGLNFKIPFYREMLLVMGVQDVSRQSIMHNLTRAPGSSMAIVIGGAAESIHSKPCESELVLGERKGFVKVALQTGASLVPVFSFGETDIFQVCELQGRKKRLQMWAQKKMGFAIPLFFGRALTGGLLHKLFGCNLGIFPFRVPIHSVCGRPIDCPRLDKDDITQDILDEYHKKYMEELKRVFEEWKPVFEEEKKKRISDLEEDPGRKSILEDKRISGIKGEGKDLKIK
jgi:2-acylglycerol O-acyltransferase 2